MPELPNNLSSIAYFRNSNFETFDIVELLHYSNIEDNMSAKSFLKNALKHVFNFTKKQIKRKKKKKSRKLVEFAKTIKANEYAVRFVFTKTDNIGFKFFVIYLRSVEANIYYIQCIQDRVSLNRKIAFANSAIRITDAIAKRYSYNYQTKIISLIEGIMNRESLKNKMEIMSMDLPGY